MCVYSMVVNDAMRQWPNQPFYDLNTYIGPTREQMDKIIKLLEAAKEYDAATGQKDCEDPDKVDWISKLEKRIAELEKKVGSL